ncbi:hypothetical protein JW887_02835 [Candidatus Dojkabacteria bacterium]|nr:hypothetical protein [Candidatus Dojkabacteria bacterium]
MENNTKNNGIAGFAAAGLNMFIIVILITVSSAFYILNRNYFSYETYRSSEVTEQAEIASAELSKLSDSSMIILIMGMLLVVALLVISIVLKTIMYSGYFKIGQLLNIPLMKISAIAVMIFSAMTIASGIITLIPFIGTIAQLASCCILNPMTGLSYILFGVSNIQLYSRNRNILIIITGILFILIGIPSFFIAGFMEFTSPIFLGLASWVLFANQWHDR